MHRLSATRHLQLAWIIAGMFYLYEFLHRVAPTVMVADLMADFQTSHARIGHLSAMYYYAYAIMQIPVGFMVDRYNIRWLLVWSAVLIGIGSVIFSRTTTLWVADLSRLLIGVGSAFSFTSCLKMAHLWFPPHQTGFLIGITNLLGVLGAILGGHPLAHWVHQAGWRFPMLCLGGCSFLFAGLLFVTLKNTPPFPIKRRQPPDTTLKLLFQHTMLWRLALFGGFMVIPVAVLSELWGVDYLHQQFALPIPTAAFVSSVSFFGIACGGPIIGWLAGRSYHALFYMRIGALCAALSSTYLIYGQPTSVTQLIVLHFIFGFMSSSMLLCFALSKEYVPSKLYATTIGFTNTVVMAMSVLFQPIVGFILDYGWPQGYHYAFFLIPVCQITAYALTFAISRK